MHYSDRTIYWTSTHRSNTYSSHRLQGGRARTGYGIALLANAQRIV